MCFILILLPLAEISNLSNIRKCLKMCIYPPNSLSFQINNTGLENI